MQSTMSVMIVNRQDLLRLSTDPNTIIADITNKSDVATFVKFSPSFPHGDIPVPGSDITTESVEGAWQGLKVFENECIDIKKFRVCNMKGLNRPTGLKRGRLIGFRFGLNIVDDVEAMKMIFIPMYKYVLENRLANEVAFLQGLVREGNRLVLLDCQDSPHASMVKAAVDSAMQLKT